VTEVDNAETGKVRDIEERDWVTCCNRGLE